MGWRIQIEKTDVQITEDKVESIYSGKIVPGFEYRQQMNKRFSSIVLDSIAGPMKEMDNSQYKKNMNLLIFNMVTIK